MKLSSLPSRLLLTVVLFAFYACSEPEITQQVEPLPSVPCSPSVVEGYCDKTSYDPGEMVRVFLNGNRDISLCALNVYSLNHTVVFSVPASLTRQTISAEIPSRDGYGFVHPTEFQIPDNVPSGIYLIEGKIPLIVKARQRVDVLVLYPSNTANAYATAGGESLYTPNRPTSVSFHRPMGLQPFSLYCLDWLNSLEDISIGYLADQDMDDYESLLKSGLLVVVGHSEYWTRQARRNFDRFVNEGNDAIILSGNTMWWQVRYAATTETSQLVCYKSWEADPEEDGSLKTGLWNDPRLSYPVIASIGADFQLGGYGLKADRGWNGYKIISPGSPLLAGTELLYGDVLACPTTEYDGAPIAYWREDGDPVLDLGAMNVSRGEILGFDLGYRNGETQGTFIVFQRRPDSGIIVNAGSTDWCSLNGMGHHINGENIRRISRNAVKLLLRGENVFSD